MRSVAEIVASVGVPFWQHTAEFIPFCEWLRKQNVKSVLEIGTGFGGSAYVFGEITEHGKVVSVDLGTLVSAEAKRQQPNPNFVQMLGNSRTDEMEAKIWRFGPFDLVFFDSENVFDENDETFRRYGRMATIALAQHDINMDEQKWESAGTPRFWRDVLSKQGTPIEFIAPAPDPRFPRWGGIGAVRL